MPDYIPKFLPGQAFTLTATAAITGGQLVNVAGAPAVANDPTWLGVASRDAAVGQSTGVYSEGVQKLTAAAAISAGARVKCAAAGQITTFTAGTDAADLLVGIAMEAAAGAASVIKVKLVR